MNNAIRRRIALCAGSLALPLAAWAQSADLAELNARLAPAYAQMLTLTLLPDLSTAHYRVNDAGQRIDLDMTRLGAESVLGTVGDHAQLLGRFTGGYLRMTTSLPVSVPGTGNVSTRWTAYGLSGGLAVKFDIGHGVTLVPAFDAGVTRLSNRTGYSGAAVAFQPLFDGTVFNWDSDAWIVTPHLGIDWVPDIPGRRITVHAHTAWSRIETYGESDPARSFRENSAVYSLRADHALPTTMTLFDRQIEWALYGGYSGFMGPRRSILGFSTVSEVGIGMQAPLAAGSDASKRLRIGVSYLFGQNVHGWTVSVGLSY